MPQKFNGPRFGRYPGGGGGYSFALAIWVCTSVALKSTVFQSNLYSKTIVRFSPSFRKNIQHFHLISLPDITLHTETNYNLKKSIHVKASRPLVSSILKGSIDCQRIAFSGSYGNSKSCVFIRA